MTLTTEPGAKIDAHDPPSQPAGEQPSGPGRQRLVAGRYRLIEPLGRGGMGRVYRAHDDLLDRPVAVKLIYDDAVSERDMRRACAVEARAAARLSHPGIVRILDSGFDDGVCFVVMELAEGETLTQIIRECGRLLVERALGLAAQIADALEEAHRQGVVHCDVKPGNLVVDRFERIRLVDFGIARVTNSSTGLTDQDIHGSAKYVAPEQVEGGEIDARTDVYALGVVLFEMLAGRPPFSGDNLASILAQRLVAEAPSVRSVQPDIPAEVDRIVSRAMAREPGQRYQTAGALRDALRAARDAFEHTEQLPLAPIEPKTPRRVGVTEMLRPQVAAATAEVGPWLARTLGQARTWTEKILPRPGRPWALRWPSLPAAIGMVALLGLVTGIAAAQCSLVASTAGEALTTDPVEAAPLSAVAPVPTEPPVVPTVAPTSAPVVAPTEPPPATATNPPLATTTAPPPPEPTAVVATPSQAAPARPAPPARVLSAPAPVSAPALEPAAAPTDDEQPTPIRAEEPQSTAKPESPPVAPKPTAQPPTLRSTIPDPVTRPANPPSAPPAAKPQNQPPAQSKPFGSQPVLRSTVPDPAPKPSSGNNGNGNGRGNGNGGGNNDEKQKKR